MSKNSVRTSPQVASKAAKVLQNPKSSKTAREIAASTLSNLRSK